MELKVKKLNKAAEMPAYASDGASAFDLVAMSVNGSFSLGQHAYEGSVVEIDTGLAFEVPPGWVMAVNSRSGHGRNYGVRLANAQGWIDSDYRGPVKIILTCDRRDDGNGMGLYIAPGDRVAQAMLIQAPRCDLVEVDELSGTARGAGGFGSTGAPT